MFELLKKVHRFFSGQLFYPILLSSALAVTIYLSRIYLSHNWLIYRNLVWNLFLAWVPYGFSILAAGLYQFFPRQWWLLIIPGGLWLLFFPNAAYIVTDFSHLGERPYVPLWYDILLLATFAWTGIFLAITSLRTMQVLVKSYLGGFMSWIFVAIAMGLNGLGIYLGRFERWNSWDFFLHPRTILVDIARRFANPFDNLRFFGFTILITAFLIVCYLTFVSVHRLDEKRDRRPPDQRNRI